MFERYTEQARRALFFARYEAFQLGSPSIETEHVLLGLFREEHSLTSSVFARARLSIDDVRREIEARTARHAPSSDPARSRSATKRSAFSNTPHRKPTDYSTTTSGRSICSSVCSGKNVDGPR